MIKNLTIELALKKPPMPKRPVRSIYSRNPVLLYPVESSYDVVILHYDLEKDSPPASRHYYMLPSFISKLNNTNKNKKLLELVFHFIMEYLQSSNFDKTGYIISDSYAYFCFTDEQDKVIFSTPYITSPLLFNPNDEDKLYELGQCNGTLLIGRSMKDFSLLKRVDAKVLLKENFTSNGAYYNQNIVSSLLDYHQNRAADSPIMDLRSIYEEVTPEVTLPSITAISTYEFRAFVCLKSMEVNF